jgi:hypothetical protein
MDTGPITRLRRLIVRQRTTGEMALDAAFFVVGVVFFYIIDLTIISRAAPIALRDMLDLALYLTKHAVSSVQWLY